MSAKRIVAIHWGDPDAVAVDGFTVREIDAFVYDSVVDAVCSVCSGTQRTEPDAEDYDFHHCVAAASVTSPLVPLGLV